MATISNSHCACEHYLQALIEDVTGLLSMRSELPPWPPRLMGRELAAYYTGVSPRQFAVECKQNLWPAPVKRGKAESRNPRVMWDRNDLDATIDTDLKGSPAAAVAGPVESGGDFQSRREAARKRREQK